MKIILHLSILAVAVFVEGISETDRTLRLPDGLYHGTTLRTLVTKYTNIPCDASGAARTDVYVTHYGNTRAIPVAVVVDVEDARNVETAITNTMQEIPIVVVHVRLPPLLAIKELKEHGMKSQYIESLQNVLLWLSHNSILLNGDKSSVTAIGLGPDGSQLVSALSLKSENQHLLRRGVVEFGENTVFSIDKWFGNLVSLDAKFKSKLNNVQIASSIFEL